MGRQIAIAMTREDETQFLSFLRASSVVRVFHFSAPSVAEREIAGPDLGEGSQYFISPAVFNWKPEFKQVSQLAPVVERRGWFYISNTATAPEQIEFIELIVDELTQNGVVMPERLFESPITDVNAQGPLAVFMPAQVTRIVEVLTDIRSRAVG